jgi:hypothetical protein
MKDIYLARLQRQADDCLHAIQRLEATGVGAPKSTANREALLWAVATINSADEIAEREAADADELLRLMGLDPAKYRTDAGFLNWPRIKVAWRGKVGSLRATSALLITASQRRKEAARSVSTFLADQLAPFPDPAAPAAVGRSATRHPLAAEADRLESLGE